MFKPDIKKSSLFLRWGVALMVLWSVWTKLTATEAVAGVFDKFGLPGNESLVLIVAVILAITALMLLFNYKVSLAGMVLSVFFLFIVVVELFNGFSLGQATWKDIALLGSSLALAFWPEE